MDLKKLRARMGTRHLAGTDIPRQDRTSKFFKKQLKRAGTTQHAAISGEVEGTSARPRLDRPARRAGGPVVGRQQDHEDRVVGTQEKEDGYQGRSGRGKTTDKFEQRQVEKPGYNWKKGGKVVHHRYAGGKINGPMIPRDGDGIKGPAPHTHPDFRDIDTMRQVRKDGGKIEKKEEKKPHRFEGGSDKPDPDANMGPPNPGEVGGPPSTDYLNRESSKSRHEATGHRIAGGLNNAAQILTALTGKGRTVPTIQSLGHGAIAASEWDKARDAQKRSDQYGHEAMDFAKDNAAHIMHDVPNEAAGGEVHVHHHHHFPEGEPNSYGPPPYAGHHGMAEGGEAPDEYAQKAGAAGALGSAKGVLGRAGGGPDVPGLHEDVLPFPHPHRASGGRVEHKPSTGCGQDGSRVSTTDQDKIDRARKHAASGWEHVAGKPHAEAGHDHESPGRPRKRADGGKVTNDVFGAKPQDDVDPNVRKDGGRVKKWIQKAVPESHKGRLHKALGVPEGKDIPEKKLEKAEHSKSPHMRHMAQFAENVKKG